jgi:photosystem II stability/assembly factor-like uncharacterized protein
MVKIADITKIVILTFIVSFMKLAILSSQWKIVNDAISTIDFINDSTGWMAGNYGYLLKTEDGGKIWKDISLDKKWNFRSIDFISDTLGWAICDNSILRSTDGGMNWSVQGGVNATKYYFIDDQTAYAISRDSAYKTTTGCLNWFNISPQGISIFENIYFIKGDVGFVIGNSKSSGQWRNYILTTFDGGLTWRRKIVLYDFNPANIQFLNDSTGYFLYNSRLWETKDTFNTWSIKVDLIDSGKLIEDFHFFDSNQVIAVINDSIFKSYDAGISWIAIKYNFNWWWYNSSTIHCPGENNCYLLTPGRYLLQSTNQGNNWSIQKFFHKLDNVYFIDNKKGFILGGQHFIHANWDNVYMTNDGGNIWDIIYNWRGDESFLDHDRKFCLFTNNSNECENNCSGLYQNCLKLYQIANGTESWAEMCWIGYEHREIYSIFFVDECTGWEVGDSGLIMKLTPQRTWQEITSGTDLPLNKVFFINNNTGWIAGGYHNKDAFGNDGTLRSILLKSSDGGENWSINSQLDYLINDLYFENNRHGWAVGEDKNFRGVIIETTDGGNNWNVVIDGLSGPLRAIRFKACYGWAVGDNGLILKINYRNFWVSGVTIDNTPYISPGIDTVYVSATISNPDNCPLKISSVIKSQDGAIHDTITMLNQGDELWKGYWPVANEERFYTVDLILTQTDTTNENDTLSIDSRFTTSGPLVIDDLFFSTVDTLPDPGDVLYISIKIRNEGLLNTITNIKVRLTVLDTFVTIDSGWKYFLVDLPPGELSHPGEWKLTISEDCPLGIKIPIKVDISSNCYVYWSDTISIFVDRPSYINEAGVSLPKIYPNPARDIVNIELPVSGMRTVTIELYDMIGKVVLNKECKNGAAKSIEKIDVSGLPAGLYILKVRQKQYIGIEKLIVCH